MGNILKMCLSMSTTLKWVDEARFQWGGVWRPCPTVPPYSLDSEIKVLEHNTHIFAPPAAGRPHLPLKFPDT